MIRKASERGSWGWTRSDRRSLDIFRPHSICWTMTRDSFWTRFGAWSKSRHRSESGPWFERYRI